MTYSVITKSADNSKLILYKSKGLNRYDKLKQLITMSRSRDTEVDAYVYILEELKSKKWDTRNPTRNVEGEVYTQNQVNGNEELAKYLDGGIPENVVKLDESNYWVIEGKRSHSELDKALEEAINYSKKINCSKLIKAKIATGVAGNSTDTYHVKSVFLDGEDFKPISINGKQVTGLLHKDIAKRLLTENTNELKDVPIDKQLFLAKAEKINGILHIGGINKNDRAKVMASLLLSLVEDTPPNRNARPSVLINDINSRAKSVLTQQEKGNFADYIKIALPPTEDNHRKYRNALVHTLQELESLDIRSAMNAGDDILGEFYEVFLKYGNGAKEIGIVLTPRHITKFAVDVVNVTSQDLVYDPTYGTGGFLVAALDYIKQNEPTQLEKFKNNLFGIEQEPTVAVLAIVNMIFRGDGKTHIREGDCFKWNLKSSIIDNQASAIYTQESNETNEPITKVLMNPPFALKTSDEKEYKFIDKALNQMRDGGILFSVLPSSIMIKGGKELSWRKELLQKNSLLSVITFPEDLFYPIGRHTIGVFIKKGTAHPQEQNVFWVRALNDGLLKKKGKRLPNPRAANDFVKIKENLKSFLVNPKMHIENILEFQKACPIDFSDPQLELVAEAYLDQTEPNIEEIQDGMENLVRETTAFLIKSKFEQEFKND